jgi:PleD family two-component response regulator
MMMLIQNSKIQISECFFNRVAIKSPCYEVYSRLKKSELPRIILKALRGSSLRYESEFLNSEFTSPTSDTLLIVEDNDEFCSYLVDILSERYNVKTASEGNEALSLLEDVKFDLVLSDVMMPGMDGIEFARQLRLRENCHQLPIIFLSAVQSSIAIGKK